MAYGDGVLGARVGLCRFRFKSLVPLVAVAALEHLQFDYLCKLQLYISRYTNFQIACSHRHCRTERPGVATNRHTRPLFSRYATQQWSRP